MQVTLRAEATSSAAALLLRPWNEDDVQPLVEAYRDPVLRRWTRLHVLTVEEAVERLELRRRGWATGELLSFAVYEETSGAGERRFAGDVVVKRADPSGESAEVGYWTAAQARGRGVAPRAVEAVTGWAFTTFAAEGLERLELLHQVDNAASCRVAEKAGFRFHRVIPARPPYPRDGHVHIRRAGAPGPTVVR
ncbi:GNAT family N-acetyltransferase [Streptomyces cucumeris]|uniref:GNAT family N-acetyltransferase n=1 Tax=Streptomyces cucumeris TaxID=2962890 RepID=UPI003D72D552